MRDSGTTQNLSSYGYFPLVSERFRLVFSWQLHSRSLETVTMSIGFPCPEGHLLERVTGRGVRHFLGPIFGTFRTSRSRFSFLLSAQGPIFCKFLFILGHNLFVLSVPGCQK